MTDDEMRREVRAAERGLADRARFMALVRYWNATVDERERRREGLAPRPISVPRPQGGYVEFSTVRVIREDDLDEPARSRPAPARIVEPTPDELRRARARKRATAKRRAAGKLDRAAYLEQAAAPRVRALHRDEPSLSRTALAEKCGISRRAVQHALAHEKSEQTRTVTTK